MAKKNKIYRTAYIGVMGALAAVISMINIPTPVGIPLTFQVFAVALCGFALGSGAGAAAAGVYLALGCLGLPVFSGGGAGIGQLLLPTGGFLWSFSVLAFLCGKGKFSLAIAGLALNYMIGAVQFAAVSGGVSALWWLLPLAAKDLILVLLARYIGGRVSAAVIY